ncbi:hypothetical protein HY469_00595 [Candidatus Roizmanbacteria bacterium]|nr:hypothetical protein [Candidatus Roizmanbacteria bacterium]
MPGLDQQAISAALRGAWQEAKQLNNQILQETPEDTEALNRLAYALAKTGDIETSCTIYKKVLTLDSSNPIALKNLTKYKQIAHLKKTSHYTESPDTNGNTVLSPSFFLTDTEKTKSVRLVNVAKQDILDHLCPGEEVFAQLRRYDIHIKDKSGAFIGKLPDDVGRTVLKLQAKSLCTYIVKDIQDHIITIFIKYCKGQATNS